MGRPALAPPLAAALAALLLAPPAAFARQDVPPAPPPPAGPLAELDRALSAVGPRGPLAARFTLRVESVSGDGEDATRSAGELAGEVAETAAGLELRFPPALVATAREEGQRRARDPDAPAAVRDALAWFPATELAERLDAAGPLRDLLARATLAEARDDALDGAPARLLVLRLAPALSARERRYVKEVEASARLWLGPDGLPRAAEVVQRGRGRAFLVIGIEVEARESFRFAVAGGRLVAVRHEAERRWSGAGDRGERRTLATLEPLP